MFDGELKSFRRLKQSQTPSLQDWSGVCGDATGEVEGNKPNPPPPFHFTVRKMFKLIFHDCLLMFNEENQSALCKFHLLFHYRNLSNVNVGREREASVWILMDGLARRPVCAHLTHSLESTKGKRLRSIRQFSHNMTQLNSCWFIHNEWLKSAMSLKSASKLIFNQCMLTASMSMRFPLYVSIKLGQCFPAHDMFNVLNQHLFRENNLHFLVCSVLCFLAKKPEAQTAEAGPTNLLLRPGAGFMMED